MLEMRKLQKDAIARIYEAHLVHDFPKKEQKPLSLILERVEADCYECLGFFESHQLVGYMFFAGSDNSTLLLLDFFAVVSGMRGKGYGTQMIQYIRQLKYNKEGIVLEIEHPDSASSMEDYQLRKRREAFYLRNGLVTTPVEARVDGVHFAILLFQNIEGKGSVHLANQMQYLYDDMLGNKIKYQIWMS